MSFNKTLKKKLNNTHVTTVIYKSSKISTLCSINNRLQINTKQIRTPNPFLFVFFFPKIGEKWSNHLTNVFDNHFIGCDRFHSKQTPVVNIRLRKFELFLSKLLRKKLKLINTKY